MSAMNADQKDYWSAQAGPIWAAQQARMDALLAPVLDQVLTRAALTHGMSVLDIGCGAGTSTFAAGDRVGAEGRAIGLDISTTLLSIAEDRRDPAGPVSFLEADAQVHPFEPIFDRLISRFGVMFFDSFDAAFANMARALRPGARLVFATWGPIPDNPYFTLPAQVAKEVLGPLPKSEPDAPGPFALREVDRVLPLLTGAALTEITADTQEVLLTPPGNVAEVVDLLCQIGPANRALAHWEADSAQTAALKSALSDALIQFETAQGFAIPAKLNFFEAVKPA